MEITDRIYNLSGLMGLEYEDSDNAARITEQKQKALCVSHAQLPNGKQISLLKTLLTSACERNCYYCPFRAGRDFHRATLSPDEMAKGFIAFHRAGIVQGLFLSSGIAGGGLKTQDKLLATIEILRQKYNYKGYVHLKLMPGAEHAQVEAAMRLANRVSLNLEAPNSQRLARLAPGKTFLDELMQPLRWVEEIRLSEPAHLGWNGRWPSMTTQFVVGAVGESDLELLSTTTYLQKQLRLSRAYYSAFRPVSNTPLEEYPAASPAREFHLYQASFLLRDYGFDLEELPFDDLGNLPDNIDPKVAWANNHLVENPIEVNQASRHELLKLPGIGPKSADAIITARRRGKLAKLEDLKKLGVRTNRISPFVLLDGKKPDRQLVFW